MASEDRRASGSAFARRVISAAALGAVPRQVVAVVLRRAMAPLLAGLAVSFAAAFPLSRLLASLLYGIGSSEIRLLTWDRQPWCSESVPRRASNRRGAPRPETRCTP